MRMLLLRLRVVDGLSHVLGQAPVVGVAPRVLGLVTLEGRLLLGLLVALIEEAVDDVLV